MVKFGTLLLGGLLAGSLALTPALADPPKDEKAGHKETARGGLKIGDAAPTFKLTDTSGKAWNLADLTKQGKVVVLEWYNPECPAVHEHHKGNTFFNELHESYNSKGVVFLAVNSSAAGKEGSDKQRNIDSIKEFNLPYPILLDPEGTVGKSYGAKTTPHVFIVGKDGKLVYQGAAMDRKDRTNYVKAALDETLAGKPVTKAETKSWGCSVKYASK